MADEAGPERDWLLEPPGADEVHLVVELGDDARLDDRQRSALEALLAAFHEAEVQGFAAAQCLPLTCTGYLRPCAADLCGKFECNIMSVRRLGSFG